MRIVLYGFHRCGPGLQVEELPCCQGCNDMDDCEEWKKYARRLLSGVQFNCVMLSQCLRYGQGHGLFNRSAIIASKFDESLAD